MQYHLNGFRAGDPSRMVAAAAKPRRPSQVDVIIVGCGPAGLTLAAQLASIPGIVTRIFDKRSGPLEIGQADGVACRSMEMFEAFGFADRVMREAYWVNETAFWRTDGGSGLVRAERIQDVEDDLSEFPHVILNQARVHDFYLELMRNSASRLEPDYQRALASIETRRDAEFPIRATFDCLDRNGREEVVHARYLVGCDGARSGVRKHLGFELRGESARQLWGVMDVLAVTDFPDIRLKCAVQSAQQGSLLIIPREGGYLVRMYIELDELRGDERASDREVTPDLLADKARAILAPYRLEIKEVAWCSAYEIGQRVCDAFDDVPPSERGRRAPRIFIGGDACHTHSPKAGQGMNVSMADTFNLGWKLAAVIRGQASPDLLHTYSDERRAKAKELIDFDRDMARLFSVRPDNPEDAAKFQAYFQQHGRYTAGVEARYDPSMIVGSPDWQHLAAGFTVGKRFHSAPVIRLADAKPMHLGRVLKADGRWRIIAFADKSDDGGAHGRVANLCALLQTFAASPLVRHTPAAADPDAVIDFRAVFQQYHRDLNVGDMPSLLLPRKGKYRLIDYEKIFCADSKNDIFELRGIDREQGAMVVIRPDQFVALVLRLGDHDVLADFFANVLIDRTDPDARRLRAAGGTARTAWLSNSLGHFPRCSAPRPVAPAARLDLAAVAGF